MLDSFKRALVVNEIVANLEDEGSSP